jgi:ribosomal protein L11 methyltransferase
MPLYKLRIEAADLETGRTAADRLGEPPAPATLAITLFELKPPQFVVEAYYDHEPPLPAIDAALAGLGAGLGPVTVEAVPDVNWVAVSQSALPPVEAGRFIVHGSHDSTRFAMQARAIEIEAGEAFGTGHNATTTLCLEALDRLVRRRHFRHILDLGCGSGVLGIAAARATPSARVIAVDNDPVAADIAAANVKLNRAGAWVRVITASGFSHPLLCRASYFDLVLANVLPLPLVELAPAMRRTLVHGGIAVLSGLLVQQTREVLGVYRAHGFRLLQRNDSFGWAALTLANTRT